jgi:hypothetical protein
MFTAHFLTEKFKQLDAKGPGFSVVYCFLWLHPPYFSGLFASFKMSGYQWSIQ